MALTAPLSAIIVRWWGGVINATRDARPKMRIFGLFALVGFPLYGWLWTAVWPQPYENWALRILCVLLAVPLVLFERLPPRRDGWIAAYWLAGLMICLPLFFSFMWAQNAGNPVWSMSYAIALVLPLIVLDALTATLITIVGSALGAALALALGNTWLLQAQPGPFAAVFLFALVAGYLLNLFEARTRAARLRTAGAIGAHFAHELRTPLQTIRIAADLLDREVRTRMAASVQASRTPSGAPPHCTPEDLALLAALPATLVQEVDYAVQIIDLALANATLDLEEAPARRCAAKAVVTEAVRHFAWKSPQERAWLVLEDGGDDFLIQGDPQLLAKVVRNMLHNSVNSLRAAQRGPAGEVRIRLQCGPGRNSISVRDNGLGIPSKETARVFEPFYSTDGGIGLGLHFCRSIVERCGGSISVRSRPGEEAEFRLDFPNIEPHLDDGHFAGRSGPLGGLMHRGAHAWSHHWAPLPDYA